MAFFLGHEKLEPVVPTSDSQEFRGRLVYQMGPSVLVNKCQLTAEVGDRPGYILQCLLDIQPDRAAKFLDGQGTGGQSNPGEKGLRKKHLSLVHFKQFRHARIELEQPGRNLIKHSLHRFFAPCCLKLLQNQPGP